MDEYVREALQDSAQAKHTETVIAILTTANWELKLLSNPDMKQDLVVALKEPWLYYRQNQEMPYGLEQLTRENAAEVHNAAIAIAATLVMKKHGGVKRKFSQSALWNWGTIGEELAKSPVVEITQESLNVSGTFKSVQKMEFLVGSVGNVGALYVRDVMVALWTTLNAFSGLLVIQGCPGSGKSSLVWAWFLHSSTFRNMAYVCINERYISIATGSKEGLLYQNDIFKDDAFFASLENLISSCEKDVFVIDGIDEENVRSLAIASRNAIDRGKRIIFLGSGRVDILKIRERLPITLEKFIVPSWTLEEYIAVSHNDDFWNCVESKFEQGSDRDDTVQQKYYYAGGCARWMLGYTQSEVIEFVLSQLEKVHDLRTLLTGVQGPKSGTAVNHLLQIVNGNGRQRAHFLVSKFALTQAVQKSGMEFVNAAEALAISMRNPVFEGWVFEEKFKTHLRNLEKTNGLVNIRYRNDEQDSNMPVGKIHSFYQEIEVKEFTLDDTDWVFPLKYNQGGFDLVQVDGDIVRFFQVTLGNSPHALKLHLFRAFLGQLAMKRAVSGVDIIGLVEEKNVLAFEFQNPISNLHNIANLPSFLEPSIRIGYFRYDSHSIKK